MAQIPQAPPAEEAQDKVELHPLEAPDEDIAYCLNFLKPVLESTIAKLYDLGKPGWGSYCELFYQTISDVMVAAQQEGEQ